MLGLLFQPVYWACNRIWPGWMAEMEGRAAFADYLETLHEESLDAALVNYRLAVEQRRASKHSTLASTIAHLAEVSWRNYRCRPLPLEELDTIIAMALEALDLLSNNQHTEHYITALKTLCDAYFEQYRISFPEEPIFRPKSTRPEAFDNAMRYYTELKDNPASGSLRITAQIQMGVLIRMKCYSLKTMDQFDDGIQHLHNALKEVEEDPNSNGKDKAATSVKATCLTNLAKSYELRYELMPGPIDLDNLTNAIDNNTKAQRLLEKLGGWEYPECMANLAHQLFLRGWKAKNQADFDQALLVATAATSSVYIDKASSEKALRVIRRVVPDPATLSRAAYVTASLMFDD